MERVATIAGPRLLTNRRPSTLIGLGVVLLVLGTVVLVFAAVRLMDEAVPDHRVLTPGTIELDIGDGDRVNVFVETRSVIDGDFVSGPNEIGSLGLAAFGADGRELRIDRDPWMGVTYEFPSFRGERVALIDAPGGGIVRIEATLNDGGSNWWGHALNGAPILAASSGSGLRVAGWMVFVALPASLVMALGTGLGVVGVVLHALRRSGAGAADARARA